MALRWLWVASPRLKRSGPSSEGEPAFAEVRFRAHCRVGGEGAGLGGSRGGRGSTRYDLTIVKQKRTLRTRWRICSPLRCRWKCFPTTRPAARNPNGILPLSPGLLGTSYPGVSRRRPRNPERVVSGRRAGHVERRGCNPFRVEVLWRGILRVARSSQP